MSETTARFRTTLEATGGSNVALVVPDEVVASFGRGKRVPVRVTVDDTAPFASSIGSMGGRSLISFNAAVRAATGRGAGDEVDVHLEVDDAPRTVEVPEELRTAMATEPDADRLGAAWAALPPGKQKAHALSVTSARTDETRHRRVAAVLQALRG